MLVSGFLETSFLTLLALDDTETNDSGLSKICCAADGPPETPRNDKLVIDFCFAANVFKAISGGGGRSSELKF